jgi:hypothetical protein
MLDNKHQTTAQHSIVLVALSSSEHILAQWHKFLIFRLKSLIPFFDILQHLNNKAQVEGIFCDL